MTDVSNHWPQSLRFVRHGESQYNVLREQYPREVVAKMVETAAGRAEIERLFAQLPADPATPLTDRGRQQARQTGIGLRKLGWQPDRIYVSPYYRTRETAILLINELVRDRDTIIVSPYGDRERQIIKEYSGYELPALDRHVSFDSEEHEALIRSGRCRFIEVVEDSRVREREFGAATLAHRRDDEVAVLARFDAYFSRPERGESLEDVKARVRDFIAHLTRKPRGKNIGIVTHALTIMCTRAVLEKRLFRIPEVLLWADDTDSVHPCAITTYRRSSEGMVVLERYNEVLWDEGPIVGPTCGGLAQRGA